MKVVMLKTSEIKGYENNPRANDAAVDFVANSIKEFGFKQPIIVDFDYVIVAGHTRHKAAIQLGMKEVPCLIADDLTEEQIKAYRLADNKVSEYSVWDMEKLREGLEGIENINMDDLGFADITEMLNTDDLFSDADDLGPSGKDPDLLTCPDCGEVFEA